MLVQNHDTLNFYYVTIVRIMYVHVSQIYFEHTILRNDH